MIRPDANNGFTAGALDATHAGAPDPTSVEELMLALGRDGILRTGDTYGPFTIQFRLRHVGPGALYLARQAPFGRLVMFKILSNVGSEASCAKFRDEALALAQLHHTHLVPVYAAGRKDDRDYYVMPYIRGATLRELLTVVQAHEADKTDRDLNVSALVTSIADAKDRAYLRPWDSASRPWETSSQLPAPPATLDLPHSYFVWVVRRIIEAAQGLASAHDLRILHLDLKPSNVMVEAGSDQAKVIDFGQSQKSESVDVAVTVNPATVPPYSPPEMKAGRADKRSDIYGLGACLYELVTLQSPHATHTVPEGAPIDLVAIARKAMEPNPNDRYPTMAAFATDLQRWLDGRVPKAQTGLRHNLRAFGRWCYRHTARLTIVALIVFFATVGVGVMMAAQEREHERLEEAKQAAEVARDRAELETKYEKAVVEPLRALREPSPTIGWPKRVADQLRDIQKFRPASDLREHAADTLFGLDMVQLPVDGNSKPANGRLTGLGAVAYSPDGKRIVAGGWSVNRQPPSTAVLWDGEYANAPVESTRPGAGPVAFPDADSPLQLIVPTDAQQRFALWNVGTNKTVLQFPVSDSGFVMRLLQSRGVVPWVALRAALSPDARFAAALVVPNVPNGMQHVVTMLWAIDRQAGTVRKIGQWNDRPTSLAFSPDGEFLAVGSDAGAVVVRKTADGAKVLGFEEGDLAISAMAFGRNYRRLNGKKKETPGLAAKWLLGVGSKGGALSVWNLSTGRRVNSFYGSEHAVYGIAFSPDGTNLASCGRNNPFVWDVGTGRPLLKIGRDGGDGFWSWTEGVAFSPRGDQLAFGSGSVNPPGGLTVYRVDADRGVRTYRGLTGVIEKMWLSPTGKYVGALSQTWQLGIWERDTGKVVYIWDVPEGITADNAAAAFDANDTEVVFASGSAASRWSLKSGELTDSWTLPLGLNDFIAARPGKPPLLVRRDQFPKRDMMIRARELLPNGVLKEVYTLTDIPGPYVGDTYLSTDGRYLVVNKHWDTPGGATTRLYNGLTGEPIALDRLGIPRELYNARVIDSGRVLVLTTLVNNQLAHSLFRLPDLTLIREDPRGGWPDDAAKLAAIRPGGATDCVQLYRIGETEAILTFDRGRLAAGNPLRLSNDGRFMYWGRRDGTVCVADVNKLGLTQLASWG